MPLLTELPNGFFKIKPFLPPHGVSMLPSVFCPDLDSSLIYTTPLGAPLCCSKEGPGSAISPSTASGLQLSDAQLHHFPITPEQRTPAVLPPGTAHTSLWGRHRESFLGLAFTHLSLHCEVFTGSDPPQPGPHLTPGGVRLCAWCLSAGRARSFCRGGIWRPPERGGGVCEPLAALYSCLWLALPLQRQVPEETN